MNRSVILHPFLFSIYAVTVVYSRNSAEVPVQWVIRPTLVLLTLVAIIFFTLRYKVADEQYAGMLTTLALFWLFFGHFHRVLLEKSPIWGTSLGILTAFCLWTIPLIIIGSKLFWKRIKHHSFVTIFLNATSIIIVLLPVYYTGSSLIRNIWQVKVLEDRIAEKSSAVLVPRSSQPDIYLIILDSYGGEDLLREVYSFDNKDFIEYLHDKGFYVASQSTPNYPQTGLSLSSMLNIQYLDDFTREFQNTNDHGLINELLQHSEVRRSLHDVGYQFIALPSGTLFTQIRDADIYFRMTLGDLNEFEGLLLSSSIANLAIDAWDLNVPVPSYKLHRRYILFSLDTLTEIPQIKRPKFVFVHIMAPHPPFVLNAQGMPIQPERPYSMGDGSGFLGGIDEYEVGYIDEIRFLNQQLTGVIDTILAKSEQPPIIIIQGDHGPGNYFKMTELDRTCLWERYSILNAYYFPDGDYSHLYPTITPVNSFRVIFNQYFGTNYDLLEDRNFYASGLTPYVYNDVSDLIQTCELIAGK